MNTRSKAQLAVGLIAVLFAFALLAGVARAGSRPAGMSNAEYRALLVRSDALNRMNHLGKYSRTPAGMTAAEYRALRLRSEGLNRAYGLGGTARPSVIETGFEWSAFGIGAAAMAGLVLLASGIAASRYGLRARTSS
jgi:uncharacterized membrane protein YbhN (UPF0104 family)